jgi:hypothetical protein
MVTPAGAGSAPTPIVTATVTATATRTAGQLCSTTITTGFSTFTNFPAASGAIKKRDNDSDLEEEALARRQLAAYVDLYCCQLDLTRD